MKLKKPNKLRILFFIFYSFLLVLSGCLYDDELVPQITSDYSKSSPIIVNEHRTEYQSTSDFRSDVSATWLPPHYLEKRWRAIIIHHSATDRGNAAIFGKWHSENNRWEGIGYDFVIGNGTDSPDGGVEVTFRWRKQITGAHCGGTPGNWANKDGIGICFVGNFNKSYPTTRQMQALVRLVRFLKKRYAIDNNHIYGHRNTPGAHITDCPGTNFSLSKFKAMLY